MDAFSRKTRGEWSHHHTHPITTLGATLRSTWFLWYSLTSSKVRGAHILLVTNNSPCKSPWWRIFSLSWCFGLSSSLQADWLYRYTIVVCLFARTWGHIPYSTTLYTVVNVGRTRRTSHEPRSGSYHVRFHPPHPMCDFRGLRPDSLNLTIEESMTPWNCCHSNPE